MLPNVSLDPTNFYADLPLKKIRVASPFKNQESATVCKSVRLASKDWGEKKEKQAPKDSSN